SAALFQENSETVQVESEREGLTVAAFEGASPDVQAIIEKHYATAVAPDTDRFSALHYAFQRGGVLVHAAPNSETREPVRILRNYVSEGQFAAPHTLIVTGPNARV